MEEIQVQMEQREHLVKVCPVDPAEANQCESCQ